MGSRRHGAHDGQALSRDLHSAFAEELIETVVH
jgi:hypothetical protein